MADSHPEPTRLAVARSAVLAALFVGAALGGLDVARILSRGDLTPATTHLLVLLLNMAQTLAVGLPLALLLALLPYRGLVRFLVDLLRLPFPGRRAEIAGLTVLLLVVMATGPLATLANDRRLAREFPGTADADPAATAGPNVIILVLDTVRADHLSLHGYHRPTTPNLERLAPEFLVCRNAVSAAPWTVPSHASLFTGQYPLEHGARSFLPQTMSRNYWSNVYTLHPGNTTLAERLSDRGYRTAGLVSNPYLSPRSGLAQGFTQYQYLTNANYLLPLRSEWLMKRLFGHRWRAVFDKPQQSAWQVNRRIERWLDMNGHRPFLLFANYMDAHLPWHAPPPFCTAFPGRLPGFHFDIPFEAEIMDRRRSVSEAELAHLHATYDGSIRYLDHHLGLLLESLRRRGLYEKSLIVIVSDHGEYFGEHQLLEHCKDVYEPAMAVPLLIRFPDGTPRGDLMPRAHLVDVMPTILATLGLEAEPGPGVDLRRLDEERCLLGENYYARIKDLRRSYGNRFRRVRQAVYQGHFKYIHSDDGDSELYDLETDPGEETNLVELQPERAEQMRLFLQGCVEGATGPEEDALPLEVDEETRARLQALGYI